MTPERAIEVLSKEKKMLRDDMESAKEETEWRQHLQELVDALELAETALRAMAEREGGNGVDDDKYLQVECFCHIPGVNDAEYIRMLQDALARQKVLTSKAVEKLKAKDTWILVGDAMPEETDSIFAKFFGKEKWRSGMFKQRSSDVWVTTVYPDGRVTVEMAKTRDGKWSLDVPGIEREVIAWMPMCKPEPFIAKAKDAEPLDAQSFIGKRFLQVQ